MEQIEPLDAAEGWCCDGRTHAEHAPRRALLPAPRSQVEDLPDEGRALARTRLAQREAGPEAGAEGEQG
jgi:hypothetical protein